MIKITNKEYNELAKEAASTYWRAIFAIDKNLSEPDQKELKKEITLNFNNALDKYEIIPFKTGLTEELDKVINTVCNRDIENDEMIKYKGFTENEDFIYKYMYSDNFRIIHNGGYSAAIYNNKLSLLMTYCEGDLCFTVCKNKESFNKEKKSYRKFYKDEY